MNADRPRSLHCSMRTNTWRSLIKLTVRFSELKWVDWQKNSCYMNKVVNRSLISASKLQIFMLFLWETENLWLWTRGADFKGPIWEKTWFLNLIPNSSLHPFGHLQAGNETQNQLYLQTGPLSEFFNCHSAASTINYQGTMTKPWTTLVLFHTQTVSTVVWRVNSQSVTSGAQQHR